MSHSFTLDLVLLVNGTKADATAAKDQLKTQLATIGLELNEAKTKLTHWSKPIAFLGYHLQGRVRTRARSMKAVVQIPRKKEQALRQELHRVAQHHHMPELDLMMTLGRKFRGWCHYYRYANNPQPTFNRLSRQMWWYYAHYLARLRHLSIRQMLRWAKRAGCHKVVKKGTATRGTFVTKVGKKEYFLDLFPPKTGQFYAVQTRSDWMVDLKPVPMANWLNGRSESTRWSALDRSEGICERCGEHPAQQVHHRSRLHTKRRLRSKIASDRGQHGTAMALCKDCHLAVHQGTYRPKVPERRLERRIR